MFDELYMCFSGRRESEIYVRAYGLAFAGYRLQDRDGVDNFWKRHGGSEFGCFDFLTSGKKASPSGLLYK